MPIEWSFCDKNHFQIDFVGMNFRLHLIVYLTECDFWWQFVWFLFAVWIFLCEICFHIQFIEQINNSVVHLYYECKKQSEIVDLYESVIQIRLHVTSACSQVPVFLQWAHTPNSSGASQNLCLSFFQPQSNQFQFQFQLLFSIFSM